MECTRQFKSFSRISDDELLRRLSELLQTSRRVESELVAHIGEVDARRLYAREAAPSMFAYCTEVLGLSEHEAYLRITMARASRKHPVLLEMLAAGSLHLSAIAKLAPYLTEANREFLLARASGKSKRQIEELVAELSPKPDVPATMRKLPERHLAKLCLATTPNDAGNSPDSDQLGPDRRLATPSLATAPIDAETSPHIAQLGPDRVASPRPEGQARVEPLSPARYRIQFTASAELHDNLERLRALMRSSVPDGDLATIVEEAVTEKLERLEAKRFATTKSPRKSVEQTDTSPKSRYVPAPVKRTVRERDGNQCGFVDDKGRRCTSRDRLEFHHREPFGRGGDHRAENVRLVCKTHNEYFAEQDYGKEMMERYRRGKDRVSEPAVVYLTG
ncbi:MAG: HNH endonuclease [Vicinamibacteria bacterium]